MRRTDPEDNAAVTEPQQRDHSNAAAADGPVPGAPEGLDLFKAGTYRFYANLAAS